MPDRRLTRRGAIVSLIALAGCVFRRSQTDVDDTDRVTIQVINHHPLDVTIFNVVGGRRDRLGDVTAAMTRTFTLHMRRLPSNEVQLFADPIGSPRGVTSELVHLATGDTVEWTLEANLAQSHLLVR